MPVRKLMPAPFLSFCVTVSTGQTNNSRGFVQFNSDGKIFGMNPGNETEIKMTPELRFSGVRNQIGAGGVPNCLSGSNRALNTTRSFFK